MTKILIPILFALGTALFWGCYGPTIGNAQAPKEDGVPLWSPFKPYVFIGIAYLVIGIVGGLIMMKVKGDSFSFTEKHWPAAQWGFLAGCLGAFGALCLTSAMMYSRGNALLVMPIVFGGAVTVTALVSLYRLNNQGSFALWIGIALTVQGVVITALSTPHGHASSPGKGHGESGHVETHSEPEQTETGGSDTVEAPAEITTEGEAPESDTSDKD
ncbi:MAG: hypothetical protein AAF483_18685 [Planctomycetota bacterium]